LTTFGLNNHAVRTERWRFIRYANQDEELYDHRADPYEWTNLARSPEHRDTKQDLAKWFPALNKPEAPNTGAARQGARARQRAQASEE
jgi:hypothetical protein